MSYGNTFIPKNISWNPLETINIAEKTNISPCTYPSGSIKLLEIDHQKSKINDNSKSE